MAAPARMTWDVSVIVPFFQREPGILIKAVASALAQKGVAAPRVIVVDDGSPVSAADELRELLDDYPQQLVVLRQDNGGPGAARNRGIEYARGDSKFLAFLDSDDSWAPAHLATALQALNAGFDFYFCDAVHRDGATTVFAAKEIPGSEGAPIDPGRGLFEFTGNLFERVLTGCPIQASGVVYRASVFPQTFRTDLLTAGEDHFFWLELASDAAKTAFCRTANVRLGYGVNIYNGAEWASPEMLWRIFYDQTCVRNAATQFAESGHHRPVLRARIRQYRRDFIHNLISTVLTRRRGEALAVAIRYFSIDPAGAFWILPMMLQRLSGYRLRRPGARGEATKSPVS